MLTKLKKKEVLNQLMEIIKNSISMVFINFHGLNLSDETSLRKKLREKGINYKVFRKTLLKKALKESGQIDGNLPDLPGEVSVAYSLSDELGPAREVYNFKKSRETLKEMLNILGGVLNNKFVPEKEMISIATIPSREVLYGRFINILNSPIQKLVYVLNNYKK